MLKWAYVKKNLEKWHTTNLDHGSEEKDADRKEKE